MNAFHIISTAPFFAKNNGAFALEDFDLFTAVISALEWRRDGSRIFLYCDAPAADYIRNAGLEKVWDGVRDTLPDDLDGIDPEMFWAAGKLLALRQMDAPCVMIDTDLIVWSKPEFGRDIIAAHREDLNPDVYPPLEYFSAAGHILPGFSREVLPLNTAFFYVPDNDFKEFYTSQAVAFMKSAERCGGAPALHGFRGTAHGGYVRGLHRHRRADPSRQGRAVFPAGKVHAPVGSETADEGTPAAARGIHLAVYREDPAGFPRI